MYPPVIFLLPHMQCLGTETFPLSDTASLFVKTTSEDGYTVITVHAGHVIENWCRSFDLQVRVGSPNTPTHNNAGGVAGGTDLGVCVKEGGTCYLPLRHANVLNVQVQPRGREINVFVHTPLPLGLDLCGCELATGGGSGGGSDVAIGAMVKSISNPTGVVSQAGVSAGARIVKIGNVNVKQYTFDHLCQELKQQLKLLGQQQPPPQHSQSPPPPPSPLVITFCQPPVSEGKDSYCNVRWSSCFTTQYGGPSTTVVQCNLGHYPTDKHIQQYFLRVHTLRDSHSGTTRTIIEAPLVLRNSLPVPLRMTLRQFFPSSNDKETSLPHIVMAGKEIEVYDINTLAHAYVVLAIPSLLSSDCASGRHRIHLKSIWCDGAETSILKQPRDYELTVKLQHNGTTVLHGLRCRVTDAVGSLLVNGGGSGGGGGSGSGGGGGPLRVEISANLWVVNLTNLPLEYGAKMFPNAHHPPELLTSLPPLRDLPDTNARMVDHQQTDIGKAKLRRCCHLFGVPFGHVVKATLHSCHNCHLFGVPFGRVVKATLTGTLPCHVLTSLDFFFLPHRFAVAVPRQEWLVEERDPFGPMRAQESGGRRSSPPTISNHLRCRQRSRDLWVGQNDGRDINGQARLASARRWFGGPPPQSPQSPVVSSMRRVWPQHCQRRRHTRGPTLFQQQRQPRQRQRQSRPRQQWTTGTVSCGNVGRSRVCADLVVAPFIEFFPQYHLVHPHQHRCP